MIVISNLSQSFGSNQTLFKNVSLTANNNQTVALIGRSGCGKSTILRYILGLRKPSSGRITVGGVDVGLLSKSELYAFRLKIGMLFQSSALFDSLNIEENVAFPLIENYGITLDQARNKVNDVLDMVELNDINTKMLYQLSGGQQKRVALARAIITEPRYLLLDEPTSGLDPITARTIENLIVTLTTSLKTTCLIVSHDRSTILRTAHTIYMIHDHGLLDPVTPDTIHESENYVVHEFLMA
jgi:phospholipid/cholesterol/gamma-HCH transport system ATP-binding protein